MSEDKLKLRALKETLDERDYIEYDKDIIKKINYNKINSCNNIKLS